MLFFVTPPVVVLANTSPSNAGNLFAHTVVSKLAAVVPFTVSVTEFDPPSEAQPVGK
jgi:hypothetical protein